MKSILQASIPPFTFENNQFNFHLPNDKTVTYELHHYDMKTRHDPYAFEAYTLKNQEIHLEYIKVDSNTTWNGDSRGFYESLLKEKLKIKSLEVVKRENYGHFEFSTYKVDDSFILHMIFIWETHKDVFILDTKGKLFQKLLSNLDENYSYAYENEEKGSVNFDISLVKNNAFNSYFNQSN